MFGGIPEAAGKLTLVGWFLLALAALVFSFVFYFVWGAVANALNLNGFIPIDAHLLPQRAITDDIAYAKENRLTVPKMPSQWSKILDIPMESRIMIDNKLRGDELQKELNRVMNSITGADGLAQRNLQYLLKNPVNIYPKSGFK